MKRTPQEIVFSLANQMKTVSAGETIPLRKINEKTGIHYVTLKSYIELISYVQDQMPRMQISTCENGDMGVRVESSPKLNISERDQLFLFLLDHNAYGTTRAIAVPRHLQGLVGGEEGLIGIEGAKSYLTRNGLLQAMTAAEEREEILMKPIEEQMTSVEECDEPHVKSGEEMSETFIVRDISSNLIARSPKIPSRTINASMRGAA